MKSKGKLWDYASIPPFGLCRAAASAANKKMHIKWDTTHPPTCYYGSVSISALNLRKSTQGSPTSLCASAVSSDHRLLTSSAPPQRSPTFKGHIIALKRGPFGPIHVPSTCVSSGVAHQPKACPRS